MKSLSNVVGVSNDENNFPHKFLLTNAQVSKLRKFKSQLHQTGPSEGFSRTLLGPLLKTGLQLIGNVLKPLAKSVTLAKRLTAAASATAAVIHKKNFGSSYKTLMISKN